MDRIRGQIEGLLKGLSLCREETLAKLSLIEEQAEDIRAALSLRPAPGRPHIAWHFAHIAANDDRVFNVRVLGRQPKDPELVAAFGYGSTPSDENIPSPPRIREWLDRTRADLIHYYETLDPAAADRLVAPRSKWSPLEALRHIYWHEGYHLGQIQVIWSIYLRDHRPTPAQ